MRALFAGLAAVATCLALTWTTLTFLTVGAEGLVGSFLSGSLNGVTTTAAAAAGGPVDWWSDTLGGGGRLWPAQLLLQGSPLVALVLGPLLAGLVAGWITARARTLVLWSAAAIYASLVTGGATLVSVLAPGTLARVSTPPVIAFGLSLLWCAGAGLVARVLRPRLRKPLAVAVAAFVFAQVFLPGSAQALPQVTPNLTGPAPGAAITDPPPADYLRPGVAGALGKAAADRGDMAREPWLGVPTQTLLSSPTGRDVPAWLRSNAGLFAVKDPVAQLRPLPARKDPLGLRHDWFEQVVGGVPVYGSRVGVHRDRSGKTVQSLTNGMVPGLEAAPTTPTLSAEAAGRAALAARPGSSLVQPPALYLLPGDAVPGGSTPVTLTWRVVLTSADHRAMAYFVDARSEGRVVTIESLQIEAKNRRVTDYANTNKPVGEVRSEGDSPSLNVPDVNAIYDYFGDFYDYMYTQHGRDSWDDQGIALVGAARFRGNPAEPWVNAAYSPPDKGFFFGEGMTTYDVIAHEVTHGISDTSAGFWYMYQYGALSESFSDIFAIWSRAHVFGTLNWRIGEGTPAGPIRDIANPGSLSSPWGPYPAHYSEYISTCADWGGVHLNATLPSHAWYILTNRIGMQKAAAIAYRDLTMYLGPKSRFTDARVGAIQAAFDLYGKTSAEANEVKRAFGAVGIDGTHESPRLECLCFAEESLSGAGLEAIDPNGASAEATVAALLRLRETLEYAESPAVAHVAGLYSRASTPALNLLMGDVELRKKTAHLMQSMEAAFRTVGTPQGDQVVVSQALVDEIYALADAYVEADRAHGDGTLSLLISGERARVDDAQIVGRTVNQVNDYLDSLVS